MSDREHIIYEGEAFTIEWHYASNGKSQALSYFEKLDRRQKIQFLKLVEMLGRVGVLRNKQQFNYEGDEIYAFKPQPDRFLCFFFSGKKVIVTNAFRKKTQKLPKSEKDRALRAKLDYERRLKEGDYYE
ncbi:MAG: type II toxin-antitoxin system RelE/ParE family toxin [Candidatus Latescibacterota bacterium]